MLNLEVRQKSLPAICEVLLCIRTLKQRVQDEVEFRSDCLLSL